VNLTAAQLQLIRVALQGNELSPFVTAEQRAAIQAVCSDVGSNGTSEKFLIAFKSALVDAANDLDVPHGPERDVKLSRLISVFIDELYAKAREGEART
jgi:hypothetical protein